MRKFLIHLLLFISFIISISSIIEYQLDKNITNHYELQYEEVVHNTKHANCILIGASHSTNGIRPSILDTLGFKFYNFSLGGKGTDFYYHWYENIFSQYYQKPQYIIYVVEWFMFDANKKTNTYEKDSEFFPLSVFLKSLLQPWKYDVKSLVLNRTCILKYNKPDHLKYIFQKKTNYSPYLMSEFDNGFIAYELDEITKAKKFNGTDYECVITKEMLTYFEELLKRFSKENIKVIFVDPPEYGGSREIYEKLETYAYLNKLSKQYNIPFLNYNIELRTDMNTNRELFTDWDHLNSKGSIEFSKMLSNDLIPLLKN